MVTKAQAAGKAVIVAGCVPSGDKTAPELSGASLIGVNHVDRVAEVVAHALRGHTVSLLGRGDLPSLDLPRVRKNVHIDIIPISQGCLGACTYCKTVHARGRLVSYPPAAIVARVRDAVADARVREIWFSSEDVAAYGRDIHTSLASLIAAVLPELPDDGTTMLRLGMGNPPYFLDSLPALTAALRDPRVFSFLHVPVQSGSDAVLTAMKREYTVADYEAVAQAVTAAGATLATDVICGFPGETNADHAATLALIHRVPPRALNISRFHARPGTAAARLPQLRGPIVAQRSREVTAAGLSLSDAWRHLVATRVRACVVDVAADGVSLVAHTKDYAQLLLNPEDGVRLGDVVLADVTECGRWHVRGSVVQILFRPPDAEDADTERGGIVLPRARPVSAAARAPGTPDRPPPAAARPASAAAAVDGAAGGGERAAASSATHRAALAYAVAAAVVAVAAFGLVVVRVALV